MSLFLSTEDQAAQCSALEKGAHRESTPYRSVFGVITAELLRQAGRILRENIEASAEVVQARCRGIDQSIQWKMTRGGSSRVHHLRAVESPAEHGVRLRCEAVKQAISAILEDLEDPESDLSRRLSRMAGYAQVRKMVLARMEELVRNPKELMTEKLLSQVKPDKSGMTMNLGGVHARSIDRFMTNR